MLRFKVTRLWIKHKGVIYRAGDLLPENFTDRDKFRNIHPSRVGVVEVPDESPLKPPVEIVDKTSTPIFDSKEKTEVKEPVKPVNSVKGIKQAEVTKPSVTHTGTNDKGALSK